MAVKTPDTKSEQDKAYDPAQARYDREFNNIAKNETANDLKKQEQQAAEASDFSQWEREMADDDGRKPSATSNVDSARAGEQSGNWQTNLGNGSNDKTKAKGDGGKRKGPIATIIAIIGLMGAMGLSGLSLMPITIAEHFTNDGNDANKSSQRKTIHLFGKKTTGSNLKQRLSVCGAVVTFRCKMRTLTPNAVEGFEKKEFKFHDKVVLPGNRIGFSAIEFPDGSIAHDGKELAAMLRTPAKALLFNAVYSLKNMLFLGGDLFKNVLARFNLTKGKKIEGKTKAEAEKSFEESAKGEKGTVSTSAVADKPGENATEAQKKAAEAANKSGSEMESTLNKAIAEGKKLNKLNLKVTNSAAILQLGCLTYNMVNYIAVSAKIKKAAYFAGFAMIFLTLASSIKANKATEAEVAKGMDILAPSSYPQKVEDPATGQMIDNPDIGKNALDSEAYKVVAYGDHINLGGIAARLFIAGGVLGAIEKVITWINKYVGRATMKTSCKLVSNKVVQVLSFLAAPVISLVILGVTSVLPVEEWAAALVNSAIDAAAGANFTTALKGVPAGNVLFIGAVTILGATGIKFGLKPGKLKAIRDNVGANQELLKQDIAMKTYEASKTPLDITNRYSFLGSMAFQLASFIPSVNAPIVSSVTKVLSAIPGSFTMLTKNANAAYSMPVADYSDTRFNQCKKDEVYNSMSQYFDTDMFCVVRPVPDGEIDSDKVWDYLEKSGNIDKVTAEPIPGSYTEKYVKYCSNRTDPWGSTGVAAEEQTDDPKWYTGENCFITDKMPKEDAVRINMNSEYIGYKASEDIISSYPKIKDNPTPKQAFFDGGDSASVADDSTYSAIANGMSYMLGEAH